MEESIEKAEVLLEALPYNVNFSARTMRIIAFKEGRAGHDEEGDGETDWEPDALQGELLPTAAQREEAAAGRGLPGPPTFPLLRRTPVRRKQSLPAGQAFAD